MLLAGLCSRCQQCSTWNDTQNCLGDVQRIQQHWQMLRSHIAARTKQCGTSAAESDLRCAFQVALKVRDVCEVDLIYLIAALLAASRTKVCCVVIVVRFWDMAVAIQSDYKSLVNLRASRHAAQISSRSFDDDEDVVFQDEVKEIKDIFEELATIIGGLPVSW